jgi:hypothetical protein
MWARARMPPCGLGDGVEHSDDLDDAQQAAPLPAEEREGVCVCVCVCLCMCVCVCVSAEEREVVCVCGWARARDLDDALHTAPLPALVRVCACVRACVRARA